MGKRLTFKCNSCDYTSQISGGEDVGMVVKTNTVLCDSCKEVVDIVTEYIIVLQLKESDIGICPICNSKESIRTWSPSKSPCPKCSGTLDIAEDGIIEMWD